MRLRCICIVEERTGQRLIDSKGQPVQRSRWLSVGTQYHALGVSLDERSILETRMIGDDGVTPAIYRLSQFEIVSPRIPSSWVIEWRGGCVLEIAPARWLADGFWERYFDGDVEARQVFEEERQRAVDEDA